MTKRFGTMGTLMEPTETCVFGHRRPSRIQTNVLDLAHGVPHVPCLLCKVCCFALTTGTVDWLGKRLANPGQAL